MLTCLETNSEMIGSLLQFTINAKDRIIITSRLYQSTLFKLLYAIFYLHHPKVQGFLH